MKHSKKTTRSLEQVHIFKILYDKKELITLAGCVSDEQNHLDNIITLMCVSQGRISRVGSESKMKGAL